MESLCQQILAGKISDKDGYIRAAHFGEGAYADTEDFSGKPQENFFYAQGRWNSTAEYLESGSANGRIVLEYSASGVNLVMAPKSRQPVQVLLKQDDKPLSASNGTKETAFSADGTSYVAVDRARMYALVENRIFETHTLELLPQAQGLAMYAFTFTTCADVASSASSPASASSHGKR